MSTSLIVIDGVLRKAVGSQLIPEGRKLYLGLANVGRVVLLLDDIAREPAQEWLELNGCVAHDLIGLTSGMTLPEAANEYRRDGYGVDLVVVPSPAAAKHLLDAGFNTLLFTHAEYAIPAWRPDAPTGVRPWHDVVAAAKEQAAMKAKDARLRNEE